MRHGHDGLEIESKALKWQNFVVGKVIIAKQFAHNNVDSFQRAWNFQYPVAPAADKSIKGYKSTSTFMTI